MFERHPFILRYSFLLLYIFPGICQAQQDRTDPRIRNLQSTINLTVDRISDAEQKLILADSLIKNGVRELAEADEEFYRIEEQVKTFNKNYRKKNSLNNYETHTAGELFSRQAPNFGN